MNSPRKVMGGLAAVIFVSVASMQAWADDSSTRAPRSPASAARAPSSSAEGRPLEFEIDIDIRLPGLPLLRAYLHERTRRESANLGRKRWEVQEHDRQTTRHYGWLAADASEEQEPPLLDDGSHTFAPNALPRRAGKTGTTGTVLLERWHLEF